MAKKIARIAKKSIIRFDPEAVDETGRMGLCIVVVDRGFVWVGDTQIVGSMVYCVNAQNIKQWGVNRGLGELASEGPKSETEMDPIDAVAIPLRAVLAF